MNEREAAGAEVGSVIVEESALDGIDLLVMGAYGHWRWKEQVLGGVTEDALENRSVPVLLAH
jgi:nucleotide-binding universal stress UspA family protein